MTEQRKATPDEKNIAKLKRHYPGLDFKDYLILDQSLERVLIVDIDGIPDNTLSEITSCTWGKTIIVRDREDERLNYLRTVIEDAVIKDTSFVFPGRGGGRMDSLLGDIIPPEKKFFVATDRRRTETGRVMGVQIIGEAPVVSDPRIMVVDDVVMSGMTLGAIKSWFEAGNEQELVFTATTLFALSPVQNHYDEARSFGSGFRGFRSVYAVLAYQGRSGIPPVLSLSSLVGSSERSMNIQRDFGKYVSDHDQFGELIESIKLFERS